MSAKAINEVTGKSLLQRHLKHEGVAENRLAVVTPDVNWGELTAQHPWLLTEVSSYVGNVMNYSIILPENEP